MVFRIYSEKRSGFAEKAAVAAYNIRIFLGISNLTRLRLINRYDIEGVDEDTIEKCIPSVFSEPQADNVYREMPDTAGAKVFAVEFLPGQFDQRADSAAQCISLITRSERPKVRTAKIYMLYGELTDGDVEKIKKYFINPVDSREASQEKPETLYREYEKPEPPENVKFKGVSAAEIIKKYALAMDEADVEFIRAYFEKENREPTLTELRVIDTYWSDHCRHTTFNTELKNIEFEDPVVQKAYERYIALREKINDKKPVCLMDLACIAAKALKKAGILNTLDESDEINACTVKIKVETDGKTEPWLLLFKNETHNHPTEIEPFGGAATCIGGAIRDPLSGRSYVYQAMRVTGAADPLTPVEKTLPGKLPQKKLVTQATAGYSSYGNQIGLATGLVDEIYHPGYLAKHLEIGAVTGAVPEKNVRRETPKPSDIVILLGGRTGRDGCGGATGASKSHNTASLEKCGAEVQKGNAPEERKLQRLFANPEAVKLIKCCNDFGAGGVSVAVGELAEGLEINLNAVPKKYEGLNSTELAISESQERMAVAVDADDAVKFLNYAHDENLEATVIARVTDSGRMVMTHNGQKVMDVSREFLDTNGAEKHTDAVVCRPSALRKPVYKDFSSAMDALVSDLNVCSRRGLNEYFDSSIGAGTVLAPFGGKNMSTPVQAMAAKIPVRNGETDNCSVMAYGFDPFLCEADPYRGAYSSVVSSAAKLIASGASRENCWLTFQEYFEKMGNDPKHWGKPLAALLGALDAQMGLKLAAIGGKDSMSGTFENLSVPPTLVSFAVAYDRAENLISPEFKKAGHRVVFLKPETDENGIPACDSLLKNFDTVTALIRKGKVCSAWTPVSGGIAEGIFKMSMGNGIGFEFESGISPDALFERNYGAFILEMTDDETEAGVPLGKTTAEPVLRFAGEEVSVPALFEKYEAKLESVYPVKTADKGAVPALKYERKAPFVKPDGKYAKPKVLIPVFPGTNCELDSARAIRLAGGEADVFVINNLTAKDIEESVHTFARKLDSSQMLFIPGGFSGGDEPEGSAKLISSFMRNPEAADAIEKLLSVRGGLVLGICNGFQALIKLGLLPFGRIMPLDENAPMLTYNTVGRHTARLVHTRVCSDLSPFMMYKKIGEVSLVPVSHGEGRFVCNEKLLKKLAENGQIASQYCDANGIPSMGISANPNGSVLAVEGITSADGRVFGKMAHSERFGKNLYKNVPGNDDSAIFRGAMDYFML